MSHKQPVQVSNNGALNGHSPAVQRDPEVVPKAKRRTFSAEYKLRILAEADACKGRGEVGALLRRENERLRVRLQQAETIIEVQKKLSLLLGLTTTPTSDDQP